MAILAACCAQCDPAGSSFVRRRAATFLIGPPYALPAFCGEVFLWVDPYCRRGGGVAHIVVFFLAAFSRGGDLPVASRNGICIGSMCSTARPNQLEALPSHIWHLSGPVQHVRNPAVKMDNRRLGCGMPGVGWSNR